MFTKLENADSIIEENMLPLELVRNNSDSSIMEDDKEKKAKKLLKSLKTKKCKNIEDENLSPEDFIQLLQDEPRIKN